MTHKLLPPLKIHLTVFAFNGILSLVVALRKLAMPAAGGVPCVGSTFLCPKTKEDSEMANKTFFTYDEQIEKLEKEKQLVISDPEFAKITLQKLSYFSLIGGYKDLFKHKPSGNYLHGVTFEEITALYYFDEELRTLFLKYILHVERQLKSMLSYYFCKKYGEQQTAYLTAGNYNYTRKNSSKINRLITTLSKTIALPSNYSYITHHASIW